MKVFRSPMIAALLFVCCGFFLTAFLPEKKAAPEEKFSGADTPIFNSYYEWCSTPSVYISGYVPSGVTFNWIGPAIPANCDQDLDCSPSYTSGPASVAISGSASPVGEMCKYRYSLTDATGTYYYIAAVRIVGSPCL